MLRLYFSLFLAFFSISNPLSAQTTPYFETPKKQFTLPFELAHNLVIIPVYIQGIRFHFILDTGVNYTLLFVNHKTDLAHFDTHPILITGLGKGVPVEAYKTTGHAIRIGKMTLNDQTILLFDKENYAFAKKMGTQIDGVIGAAFFKDIVATINYSKKKIKISSVENFTAPKSKKLKEIPLEFHNNKPLIRAKVTQNDQDFEGTFLLDSGSSDALWLFENRMDHFDEPLFFEDYLGHGINGDVYGKRSKIDVFDLDFIKLKQVKVAYPEQNALINMTLKDDRLGSIGGELLSRFSVTLDYTNKKLYLRKSTRVKAPFYYNMSGISLEHDGVEMIKQRTHTPNRINDQDSNTTGSIEIFLRDQFTIRLTPVVVIAQVRPDSPAAQSGIQVGDQLLRVNGKNVRFLKLDQINGLMQIKPGSQLRLKIRRDGHIFHKSFRVTSLLE